MTSEEVVHEPALSRFSLALPDHKDPAYVIYSKLPDGTLDLTHTFTPPSMRGKGVAEKVVGAAFAFARKENIKVKPTCPYISGKYLERNPEMRQFVSGMIIMDSIDGFGFAGSFVLNTLQSSRIRISIQKCHFFARMAMNLSPCRISKSPLQKIVVRGHEILVKRDDLLESPSGLCGNKLRKFGALERTIQNYDMIVSWGGVQSNALAALARLSSFHEVRFVYFTKYISSWLRNAPLGNFKTGMECNVEFKQLDAKTYHSLTLNGAKDVVHLLDLPKENVHHNDDYNIAIDNQHLHIVPQGGAWPSAEPGIRNLATELKEQIRDLEIDQPLVNVIIASGTGTMALFLARHLHDCAQVFAVPVVGDASYLQQQMLDLDRKSGNIEIFPSILDVGPKRPFGCPENELLSIWSELKECGIVFDLIYAPVAWEKLLLGIETKEVPKDRVTIYYHCGGLEGNASMWPRYFRSKKTSKCAQEFNVAENRIYPSTTTTSYR